MIWKSCARTALPWSSQWLRCRTMRPSPTQPRSKAEGFVQGWNAQLAVDEAQQIVVACGLSADPTDTRALPDLVDQIERNLGRRPQTAAGRRRLWLRRQPAAPGRRPHRRLHRHPPHEALRAARDTARKPFGGPQERDRAANPSSRSSRRTCAQWAPRLSPRCRRSPMGRRGPGTQFGRLPHPWMGQPRRDRFLRWQSPTGWSSQRSAVLLSSQSEHSFYSRTHPAAEPD
jgi:hypothetical protein